MIKLTKGDSATLRLTALSAPETPHDLTGASFSTQMRGPGGKAVTFAHGKHSITSAVAGTFTLALTPTDTALLEISTDEQIKKVEGREIKTTITQNAGASVLTVRANILIVYPETPRS
ncbi:MAG: hypothetical protein WC130_05120 [Kiritimatiellia bacterium]